VLYNLDTINGVDWYLWGSDHLVATQTERGTWAAGGYHGSNELLDTCLALLFLKRANLTKDLSGKIQTLVDVKELGGR
jgi:hypothetical protein